MKHPHSLLSILTVFFIGSTAWMMTSSNLSEGQGATSLDHLVASSKVAEKSSDSSLVLWYDEPAQDWMQEALPIGNGYLGAMF